MSDTRKNCYFHPFYHELRNYLNPLFRMGFFGAAHGWGAVKAPLPKICHTYPTVMKLGTVIPYPKKIQKKKKKNESYETPFEFC